MALRVLVNQTTLKISKPGIDVSTARERDLLISLGLRSGQIIQRGFIPQPAGIQGTTPATQGDSTYDYTINFPAQSTRPDLWACLIERTGALGDMSNGIDNNNALTYAPPSQDTTFGTSSVAIRIVASNGSLGGSRSYVGITYVLFRKRLDS